MAGRYHGLKDIKEVERIFYGKDTKDEKHQYESYLWQPFASFYEEEAKKSFTCIGKVTKIPRSVSKTFDFEIKSKNIMFEVTQIHESLSGNPSVEQSSKILKAINHIGVKESESSIIRGGVIYYSTRLSFLTNLSKEIQIKKFVTQEMIKYNLNFILFLPEQAVNLNPYETIPTPKLLYVTKEHKITFDCLDSKIQRLEV